MDLGLKGKIAMVTASSKGIGYGMAKVLASEGCRVVISSRSIDSISRARDQIVEETGNREVYAFSADLTVKGDVDRLFMNAVWLAKRLLPAMERKKWGRLVFITSTTLRQPVPNLVLSNTVRLSLAGLS